ncbi:MAG: Flp pilus assembly complex ATPase component TadA [Deltaproteobacteria bacterium]|nr:Flp pilus assembly complex ATPase component TadA [Deltaproteobacteria bacterium]
MNGKKAQKPLGQILKEKGVISEDQIRFALQEQKISKEKMGEILVRLCFITEYDVATTLAEQEGIPYINADEVVPSEDALRLFNKNLCLNHSFLPLTVVDRSLEVASVSTSDPGLSQLITRQTGLKPKFYLSEKTKIINAANKFYYFVENPIEKLIETEVNILSQDAEMARGMDNLVRHVLHLAVKMRASDIHIRPMEKSTNISFRIDGVMTSALSLPPSLSRIISTLKMKADMNIAEQRLPQDGRFSAIILSNNYDFRASTIVSPYGENMVLRILPTESALMGLEQLGFFEKEVRRVQKLFSEPFGIVLLTGPTGSGKSTTLYAGIRRLNLLEKNVLTVEEPIEYDIPLLRQTQVNEKAGYTFASAIKYFLRHDPDVILVGEIRDRETAVTAITASTTGHLVLSTLHTNNAIGAIARLRDLGIRPFLIAESLIGVVSQRLIRRICPNCKEEYVPSKWEMEYLKDPSIEKLWKGRGCEACNGSGYFGRTLIYELLCVDKELSRLIDRESEIRLIAEEAKEKGFEDMFVTAVKKVKLGITSVEEITRVLGHVKYA